MYINMYVCMCQASGFMPCTEFVNGVKCNLNPIAKQMKVAVRGG